MSFILLIFAAWAVIFALQFPLRRKPHPVLRTVVFFIKLLLIPVTALLFVAIDSKIAYMHGSIFVVVYIALIGDSAADVVDLIVRCIKRKGVESFRLLLCGAAGILFCGGVYIYGTWNAENIREMRHEWKAEGLKREHTFAFAADLHAGSAQTMDTLRNLCRDINAAKPEFVILGGDVTDELTSYEDMVETYSILSELEAPVYFIYGNHDRQPSSGFVSGRTYTDEQLEEEITRAGIHILKDEYVKTAEDLVLLGREDISSDARIKWEDLKNPFEGEGALIVADHQPYDKEQLEIESSALQISGHTHAGQLWPLKTVYTLLGLPAFGEFEQKNTFLYVSAGANDWMVPIRTEEHCEWELVTIKQR